MSVLQVLMKLFCGQLRTYVHMYSMWKSHVIWCESPTLWPRPHALTCITHAMRLQMLSALQAMSPSLTDFLHCW